MTCFHRTSAHLMMWNDDYYYEIEEQFGEAVATKVALSHRAAIDFVEKVQPLPQSLPPACISTLCPLCKYG